MAETEKALAPFPYFGGKRRAAHLVWQALGDVSNYVEPFAGSLSVLLLRPHEPHVETVNDLDGFIANFWRAVQADPDGVAKHADWPVNECDLEARHAWLVARSERLRWSLEDPDFYDAKIAGWWVWGACAWIGAGWCSGEGPHVTDGAHLHDRRKLPHLGNGGRGVNRQLPHLGNGGRGVNRQLPHLGDGGHGINRQADGAQHEFILAWMRDLSARLRRVRVACGDWRRVLGNSVLDPNRNGHPRGILLDPPYSEGAMGYAAGGKGVSADVAAWAIEHGANPLNRIVLCGYEGEHDMPSTWRVVSWKAKGGYGSQANGAARANSRRERLWLSPTCLHVEGTTYTNGAPVAAAVPPWGPRQTSLLETGS